MVLAAILVGCGGTPAPSPIADGQDPPIQAPMLVDEASGRALLLGPWLPEPIPLWPALLAAVARVCSSSMEPFPAVPLVAVDARGRGRLEALFSGAGGQAACNDMTIDARGTVAAVGGGMTAMGNPLPAIGDQALRSAGVSSSGGAGDPITSSVITGQAGAGIATVTIVMPGQGRMRATLANGWYLFWWPGQIPAGTKVVGLDALGQEVATSDP
jgi:hypothetical protein